MTVETKPKTEIDKFKEATKDLTLVDVLPVAIATINSLRDLGEFFVATGSLQKKSASAYDTILKIGEQPEAFLALLVDKIPEEKLKPLVELTLKMAAIQSKFSQFRELTAEEKITIGQELKGVASELSRLLEETRK